VCEYVEQHRLPLPARVSVSLAALAALSDEGARALAAALAGAGSVRELRFCGDDGDGDAQPTLSALQRLMESQKLMRRLRLLLSGLPALQRLDVACLAELSGRAPVRLRPLGYTSHTRGAWSAGRSLLHAAAAAASCQPPPPHAPPSLSLFPRARRTVSSPRCGRSSPSWRTSPA
jgi:hypothetical protein